MKCPGEPLATITHSDNNEKSLPLEFSFQISPKENGTFIRFYSVALRSLADWNIVEPATVWIGKERPPTSTSPWLMYFLAFFSSLTITLIVQHKCCKPNNQPIKK
jgi:hypothetical protein